MEKRRQKEDAGKIIKKSTTEEYLNDQKRFRNENGGTTEI